MKKQLEEIFPYRYIGGGYFREKNVPKNTKAKILHGYDAIKFIYNAMKESK